MSPAPIKPRRQPQAVARADNRPVRRAKNRVQTQNVVKSPEWPAAGLSLRRRIKPALPAPGFRWFFAPTAGHPSPFHNIPLLRPRGPVFCSWIDFQPFVRNDAYSIAEFFFVAKRGLS